MSWRSTSALIWICRGELILRLLSIYLVLGIIAERAVISHSSAKGRNGKPHPESLSSASFFRVLIFFQWDQTGPEWAPLSKTTLLLIEVVDDVTDSSVVISSSSGRHELR